MAAGHDQAESAVTFAGIRNTGQQLIGELGLYYYKARFYSPALGRFLQTDPIGYKDDQNLYAYVGSNSVNRTDPSGLAAKEAAALAARFGSAMSSNWSDSVAALQNDGLAGAAMKGLEGLPVAGAVAGGVGFVRGAAKGASLWPAASDGRTVLNGIEYTTHALERMQPVGTIIKDGAMFSRGIPPSAVENAVKLGQITPGNSASEVVRTFENVRVITDPAGTRVISVIKIGN